jgi:hypothetical protein
MALSQLTFEKSKLIIKCYGKAENVSYIGDAEINLELLLVVNILDICDLKSEII